jgi:hypothetical protein
MLGSLKHDEMIVEAKGGWVNQGPGRFEKIYGGRKLLPDIPSKIEPKIADSWG